MRPLILDMTFLKDFISNEELKKYEKKVAEIDLRLQEEEQLPNNLLGWQKYPLGEHHSSLGEIQLIAEEIKRSADVLIVVGVGGSFLGARAVQQALTPDFGLHRDGIEVIYAGQNMSGSYLQQLLHYVSEKEVYVNAVSKSGSTMEPALSFRLLQEYMNERYKEQAKERIIVTTDENNGALRKIANYEGYRTFSIDRNIGGRYSVLTAVGLLPLAVAGIHIESLLAGARSAALDLQEKRLEFNDAYRYAVIRHILGKKGYAVELLASFEPRLKSFHEWWKQLFGESEGKEHKGIYPSTLTFSTDLHAIGQYIQEGRRIIFETLIHFQETDGDVTVPYMELDLDQLNYLAGRSFNEINGLSKEGVASAHHEGGVPVLKIELGKLDEFHLGYLIYFFMKACAMSASLLGVNPFNQPGVEAYKKKMVQLLKSSTNVRASKWG